MPRQSTVQPRTKRGVVVRRKLRKMKLILAGSRLHCNVHMVCFGGLEFIFSIASHVGNKVRKIGRCDWPLVITGHVHVVLGAQLLCRVFSISQLLFASSFTTRRIRRTLSSQLIMLSHLTTLHYFH